MEHYYQGVCENCNYMYSSKVTCKCGKQQQKPEPQACCPACFSLEANHYCPQPQKAPAESDLHLDQNTAKSNIAKNDSDVDHAESAPREVRPYCFYSKDQIDIHNFGDADVFILKYDYDKLAAELAEAKLRYEYELEACHSLGSETIKDLTAERDELAELCALYKEVLIDALGVFIKICPNDPELAEFQAALKKGKKK